MRAERQSLDYSTGTIPAVSRLAAQFSLLGGGLAWTVHFFLVYLIGEFGCLAGWGQWIIGGFTMVAWLMLASTLIGCVLGAAALLVSMKTAARLKGVKADGAAVSDENKAFITRLSITMNAVFLFIIVVQSIPIFFYLRAC